MVELRGRKILIAPGLAAVERHRGTPVVAQDHALGIVGRDPQRVGVAVEHVELPERPAAVARLVEDDVGRVDHFRILGVSSQLHVIPGAHP